MREKRLQSIFIAVLFLNFIYYTTYTYYANRYGFDYNIKISTYFLMCVFQLPLVPLLISMVVLLMQIRKYHNYQLKKVYFSMIIFVLYEILDGMEYWVTIYIFPTIFEYVYPIYQQSGYYVIIQSIGIIYLKQNKDPLENISKLGFMSLVSINQRANKTFMDNMYE